MRRTPHPRLRGALAALAMAMSLPTATAQSQTTSRDACTTGDLTACVRVSLTAEATAGGSNLLFAIRHLGVYGSVELASRPSIVWSLTFASGRGAYSDPVDITETPTTPTGTTVSDASDWTFTDVGDQWGLSYPSWSDPNLTTKGIGSTIAFAGQALDAFNQPWQQIGTSGELDAISFAVFVPYTFDGSSLDGFQIIGLEASAFVVAANMATVDLNGSCSPDSPCGALPQTAVPEPSTAALLAVGLALLARQARRRHPSLPTVL